MNGVGFHGQVDSLNFGLYEVLDLKGIGTAECEVYPQ